MCLSHGEHWSTTELSMAGNISLFSSSHISVKESTYSKKRYVAQSILKTYHHQTLINLSRSNHRGLQSAKHGYSHQPKVSKVLTRGTRMKLTVVPVWRVCIPCITLKGVNIIGEKGVLACPKKTVKRIK